MGAVVLGADDTVHISAGDTKAVIKSNQNMAAETILFSAESGFRAYGFPNNDTTWSNRNEFLFLGGQATVSDNGLYIGDGGGTQFIDLSRNLTVNNANISGTVIIPNLPTSDPGVAGQLWNSSGDLKVSAG